MQPLGDEKDHFWLAQRMAKTTGVDLVEAFDTGALGSQDWADMVTRCRGCSAPEKCGRWLDSHYSAASQPGYCENRSKFADLQNLSGQKDPADT